MFVYGFLLGALIGAFTAFRRKGNYLDMLQYGVGFGIAFGLVAMVGAVLSARMAM